MKFHAEQHEGVGSTVHAIIFIDPVLKKHSDLRNPMLKHEQDELKHWGMGHKGCSHRHAKNREPRLTRNLTVDGFWQEIKRRQKRGK